MKKRYATEDKRVKTCWSTLLKYVGNVAQARAWSSVAGSDTGHSHGAGLKRAWKLGS